MVVKYLDMNNGYPTNLTDSQWQILQKLLEPATARRRKYPLRSIVNAILYISKAGCQWRMLPKDLPPYNLVFYYFTKWRREGLIEALMDALRDMVRLERGRESSPSLGIIDARSVSTTQHVSAERGIDGHKRVKGRKVQLVVDTLGLPLAVTAHEANIHDSKGAAGALEAMRFKYPRLKKLLADAGYAGEELRGMAQRLLGCALEVVRRPDESPKLFSVIPKRWIVERSFGWLIASRRLARDYEFYADTAVAMTQFVFIRIMLNRFS